MWVSGAAQHLKGKSSHKLLSEYKSLRKRYWGQHLWGRGYWVATSSNVLTRYGRSTLRIRNRGFRTITSTSFSKSALAADRIRLLAVTRSHRLRAGANSPKCAIPLDAALRRTAGPLVLQSDYSFHFEFKMTSQKLTRLYFGSRNSSTSALTLPKVVSGFWIVPLAKASIMPFLKPCPRG